ncbi:transcriptional repressor [Arhodomonas aquaeolei]|nr:MULTISPECIES: Fur family transcriptional regulator [Arhodomonas]MCS4504525.1 transcriptional repressor [Arhodomonas aquaeolei]
MSESVLMAFPAEGHDHRDCVATALAAAERLCREQGARLTPQRRRVLELVWRGHRPAKAYELMQALAEGERPVAPPTVYRALDFLMEAGLVHRLASLNAFVGCAAPEHPHAGHFLICTRCERVAELDAPDVDELLGERAAEQGFALEHETIELAGVCAACRQSQPA